MAFAVERFYRKSGYTPLHDQDQSVAALLKQSFETMTRAERQLANVILESYPVSGLGSITAIAESAGVSAASVARMVQKLGFKGFPEFQSALRAELGAKLENPIARRATWVESASEKHVLNRFTETVISNIDKSLAQVDPEDFDPAAEILADTGRHVFIVGGRITGTLADYLFTHLQVIRGGVTRVGAISNSWPDYLLEVSEGDVVVVYDVRRYEISTQKLAERAHKRGARIVLITDQWQSPVSKFATYCFNCHVSVPSAWDSNVALMLLTETFIAAVQDANWEHSRKRLEGLEKMFDVTPFFRKLP